MRDKPHFVILAKGSSSWLGGRQYVLNLLHALLSNRDAADDYEVSLLVNGKDELACYEPLHDALKLCTDGDDFLEKWTIRNRLRWKLRRTFQGWTYPRLEEGLQN